MTLSALMAKLQSREYQTPEGYWLEYSDEWEQLKALAAELEEVRANDKPVVTWVYREKSEEELNGE